MSTFEFDKPQCGIWPLRAVLWKFAPELSALVKNSVTGIHVEVFVNAHIVTGKTSALLLAFIHQTRSQHVIPFVSVRSLKGETKTRKTNFIMFTPGDSVMSVAKFWFSSIGAKKLEKYSLRRDERTAAVKKPKKESSARMVYRISSQNASSTFPNICFVSRQTLIGTTGCRSNLSETLRLAPGKHHRGSVLDKSPK